MRASIAMLLLAATLAVGAFAQDGPRLQGRDGGELTQSDIERGATVLVVWASWSPRCRKVNRLATPASSCSAPKGLTPSFPFAPCSRT